MIGRDAGFKIMSESAAKQRPTCAYSCKVWVPFVVLLQSPDHGHEKEDDSVLC